MRLDSQMQLANNCLCLFFFFCSLFGDDDDDDDVAFSEYYVSCPVPCTIAVSFLY